VLATHSTSRGMSGIQRERSLSSRRSSFRMPSRNSACNSERTRGSRGGLHSGEEDRVSAADLARPIGTGTMSEAVGNLRTPATSLRQGLNEGQPVREDETVGTRTER